MKFVKMHGAGNDYVYLDLFRNDFTGDPSALAARVSDRHFGIGSDGLIIIMPSGRADARMRMFNADGSESAMCGNGLRCLAKYVLDEGLRPGPELTVEAGGKIISVTAERGADGLVASVNVDMGVPQLQPVDIPAIDLGGEPVIARELEFRAAVDAARDLPLRHKVTLVSMGNPHCVIFIDDAAHFPADRVGPIIEHDRHFPERCNVHFVEQLAEDALRVRTWERGSGETLACGSGASAVSVAFGLTQGWRRPVRMQLAGGELMLHWQENDHVMMRGPAVLVYRGEIDL
ncbi:MAG: diaminopimelate epimerase [Spirochaetota bacterium]|jgi:diaminopimelate epimerase|nr:diaminopimelate epimerase [Spirochaetota bacterium]